MTEKETKNNSNLHSSRRSGNITEIQDKYPTPSTPRLGRRESEPHSASISYIHDILKTNFPKHRVMWDLHHYFHTQDEIIDLQFDISFFLNFQVKEKLPSYDSAKFHGIIPDVVINILSKNTWKTDLLEHVATCQYLKIPYYIVFFTYEISPRFYKLPFLRIYHLNNSGKYNQTDLTENMYQEGKKINNEAFIQKESNLPFDIALELTTEKYSGGKDLYQIVFLDSDSHKRLLGEKDQEKFRADQEKSRADQETIRADLLEKKLKKYSKKYADI